MRMYTHGGWGTPTTSQHNILTRKNSDKFFLCSGQFFLVLFWPWNLLNSLGCFFVLFTTGRDVSAEWPRGDNAVQDIRGSWDVPRRGRKERQLLPLPRARVPHAAVWDPARHLSDLDGLGWEVELVRRSVVLRRCMFTPAFITSVCADFLSFSFFKVLFQLFAFSSVHSWWWWWRWWCMMVTGRL